MDGFENAANADAAGEVNVGADVRAAAHRGPCIDHRAASDEGPDVRVRRHEDGARRNVSSFTYECVGDDPHAFLATPFLQRNLIDKTQITDFNHRHLLNPEVKKDRFFHPFVHDELIALPFFDNADGADVETLDHLRNRVLDFGRVVVFFAVERGFDVFTSHGFELVIYVRGHRDSPLLSEIFKASRMAGTWVFKTDA